MLEGSGKVRNVTAGPGREPEPATRTGARRREAGQLAEPGILSKWTGAGGAQSLLDLVPVCPRPGAPSRTRAASAQPRTPDHPLGAPAGSPWLFRTCTRGRSCAGAARAGPRK